MATAADVRGRAAVHYQSTSQINRDASPSRGGRRTIAVKIASASKMVNPLDQTPLTEPVVHLGLGKFSKAVNLTKVPAERELDRFKPGETVNMPYNGETVLRIMLSDGVFQCGWADVLVGVDIFTADSECTVTLQSRVDPKLTCGTLVLGLNRSSARVQSDVVIERTPLHKSEADARRPASPAGTTAAVSPAGPSHMAAQAKSRSCRAHVLTLRNLRTSSGRCKAPYIVLAHGSRELRGPTVRAEETAKAATRYDRVFTLPLDGAAASPAVKVLCFEERGSGAPVLIGSGVLSEQEATTQPALVRLVDGAGATAGEVEVATSFSAQTAEAGVVALAAAAPTVVTARSEETTEGVNSTGGGRDRVGTKTEVTANSLRVKVSRHFDETSSAFVKAKLGEEELRVAQFGDVQADEMVFPYASERFLTFTAQQDKKAQRDPVLGVGQLDLTPVVSREQEGVPCVVTMTHPESGAAVGELEVLVTASSERQPKARVVAGPSLLQKTELPEHELAAAVEITVIKVVDPPICTPGHEFQLQTEFGKESSRRTSPPAIVAPSGEVDFRQSYLCKHPKRKFAKIALVDAAAGLVRGHAFLDCDQLLRRGAAAGPTKLVLSHGAGTMLVEVGSLDRKIADPRFVPAARVQALRACKAVEVKVLAAYDLRYESTSDVLDPYCELLHGPFTIEGKQRKDAGLNPIIMETFTLPLEPGEPLKLRVSDKARLHKDTEIGVGALDATLLDGSEQIVVLMKDGAPAGSVLCVAKALPEAVKKPSVKQEKLDDALKGLHSTDLVKFDPGFEPAWTRGLVVAVHCARNLGGAQTGKAEAEPSLTLHNGPNQVHAHPLKVKLTDAVPIEQHFAFPRSIFRILRFDVHDKKLLGGKKLIGSGHVDLIELAHLLRKANSTNPAPATPELQREIALSDEFGRPAGSLYVSVCESSAPVTQPLALDEPPLQKGRPAVCYTSANSCRVRVAEGEGIDLEANPFVKLEWFSKETRTRTLTTADPAGRRIWQDVMLLPCIPAQRECVFTLQDNIKLARDPVLGHCTVTDLEKILTHSEPTDRWLEFQAPQTGLRAGRVRVVFEPSEATQSKLRTIPATDAIPAGTYNAFELTVIRTADLDFHHGKDICDPYCVVRHDTFRLKGKVHKDAGVNAEILETYTLPIRPGYPIELSVTDANTFSGDIPIGAAKLFLPDLVIEQPEGGEHGELYLSLDGRHTGRVEYKLNMLKEAVKEPRLGAAEPSAVEPPVARNGELLYQSLDIEVVKLQDVPLANGIKVDPYVYVILGNHKLRGHTLESTSTGSSAVGDLFRLPVPAAEFIKFEVYDDQKLRRDPVLASAKLSLATIVNSDKYTEVQRLKLPLFKNDGSSGGNLFMKVRGYAAAVYNAPTVETLASAPVTADALLRSVNSEGSSHGATRIAAQTEYQALLVEVLYARNIGALGTTPYVVGRLGESALRTHTVEDAANTAAFGDEFFFPFQGQRKLKLTLYDDRKLRKDEELGYCKVDLEPVFFSENSGEPQYLTGSLVQKKTGELTEGEITILVTPLKTALAKAYAVKPGDEEAHQFSKRIEEPVISATHPGSCLTLDDIKVIGLERTPIKGLGDRLNPYVVTRLGKAKLRTDKPLDGTRFDDSLEFNMLKAPGTLEFLVMNNIKFNPDAKLGMAKLELATLRSGEGVFSLPLVEVKTGKKTGATISGSYMWSQKVLRKKALILSHPVSPLVSEVPLSSSTAMLPKHEQPSSYLIKVGSTTIQGGARPYLELSMEGGKKMRLNHCFLANASVEEVGKLPASAANRVVQLVVKDNKKLQIDPVLLRGAVDLNAVRIGEKKTCFVKCSGDRGYQEIDLEVTGSDSLLEKPIVQELAAAAKSQ